MAPRIALLLVVPQILGPLESDDIGDLLVNQVFHDLHGVHVDDNERVNNLLLELGHLGSHSDDNIVHLLVALHHVLLGALDALGLDSRLDLLGPVDLRAVEDGLADVGHDPLDTVHAHVLVHGLVHLPFDALLHFPLDAAHPVFDVARGWVHRITEHDSLASLIRHRENHFIGVKLHLVNLLKDLHQMRLHFQRILGLRENLQEIVVREEVES